VVQSYATLRHRLENAHAAAEAALIGGAGVHYSPCGRVNRRRKQQSLHAGCERGPLH
jgi:hypothetical protein